MGTVSRPGVNGYVLGLRLTLGYITKVYARLTVIAADAYSVNCMAAKIMTVVQLACNSK